MVDIPNDHALPDEPYAGDDAVEALPVDDLPSEAPLQSEPAAPDIAKAEAFVPPDNAYELFDANLCGMYKLAGHYAQLATLTNAPNNPDKEPAHHALFDIVCETPWLRFLLDGKSLWVQRLSVVAMFYGGLTVACAWEVAAKKKAARDRAAANDNRGQPAAA